MNTNYLKDKPIKTIDEYMKTYFPKEYLAKKIREMTPTELGKYLAEYFILGLKKGEIKK